ncbi:BgTH12-05064 [Blumeria graminis f. sp. triticale]|uniref:BgTH12-05064 n=1 Tax=Blumeria graminis f. sp. triticale TaxID=1689686 RepID=A0A9W4D5T8_BLUGR|nr:BgTH12-05064 [Blumeria graminis f. sp. triticale]
MALQDSFIDEDEDTCPLCVEEFDLSDKNFRPCPCGYQICQFCFNNIKNNINGLCPACRRPYDEKTIEWKVVTQEEMAQFKANIQKNAKKKQEQRQKEAQKREVESLNRKHLSGLRVVQKNLVYVVGISPGIPEQEILSTLRGEKYFGQYGKIVKIVVSNKKQGDAGSNNQSLGVYVTFARKEDASRCIAAVNGSQNGDRVLRAQLGTTKYCSAYLRNETCTNKNCMFLHEPGDNDDSYSRQDLSSINSVNTQRPLSSMATASGANSRQSALNQNTHMATAIPQTMMREGSKDELDCVDGSALPSSASWANRGLPQRNRRDSHSTSIAASSPAISHALPATAEVSEEPPAPVTQKLSEPASLSSSTRVVQTNYNDTEDAYVFKNILKAINSSNLSFPPPKSTEDSTNIYNSYPPLFDEHGGQKRRAQKVHQEDVELHIEQDPREFMKTIPEPPEDEEPESGSLQLGGEPEDRESSREGALPPNFHNQQANSQLPIHRIANNNSSNLRLAQPNPHNSTNLNTSNGRAFTPLQQQQHMHLMKSNQQSELPEQYPSGIGNQLSLNSSLFQQGHGRQASRYNFANDSSNSMKTSANSKLMAQQSSMMPSANFSQQTGFYPQSIQGPPPGLKSSATPPTNGSMFGQNLGFSNSMSGTLFSGLQKENNSEMLRDIIRGRGNVGGSQTHDTGKREYMFSSFLHQYPPASTPAQGPGLASIYGPQTGAFHDFGQKQKKKGKKHRHANTSSSGGGGIVDLADPSILQARMQHQQHSNSGVAQGLFGGQAQGQILPSLDEARSSVDALVGDSVNEDYHRTSDVYGPISRSLTPLVPPGFSIPLVQASFTPQDRASSKPSSLNVPVQASFVSRKVSPGSVTSYPQLTPLGLSQTPVAANIEIISPLNKQDEKPSTSVPTKPGKQQSTQHILQTEDFPALQSGKRKATTVRVATPASLITFGKNPASNTGQSTDKSDDFHTIPNAGAPATIKNNSKGTASMEFKKPSAFPPLPASTTNASHHSSSRNIPKTLRLTTIPKSDALTTGVTTPTHTSSIQAPQTLPSRHHSLSSNVRLDRPGTPTSEITSDNISITSTSFSRASSPPLTRVGSAPVRTATKSFQKKQRQAQKEKERAEIEAAVVVEPEVEIPPIMGRKKKQKKERLHSTNGGLNFTISRPITPGTAENKSQVEKSIPKIEEQLEPPTKNLDTEVDSLKVANKLAIIKSQTKVKPQNVVKTDPTLTSLEVEKEEADKPLLTPAIILQEFVASGVIKDLSELYLLKNITSSYKHLDMLDKIDKVEISPKLVITPEDHDTLLAGKPVHKNAEGGFRIMLTPNGDCVRNLTEEEEIRYLYYQDQLAKDAGPTAFFSAKHAGQNGFTMIGGRAVPSGPPSFFPVLKKANSCLDPVSKIQRDEALNYINQYVLPTLSSCAQYEKTLYTNEVQGEMMRTDSVDSTLKTWGPDQASTLSATNDFYMSHSLNSEGVIENITTHFAIGEMRRQGNGSLLSLTDAEPAMQLARKEVEGLEKKLNALIKKNRRILLGAGH